MAAQKLSALSCRAPSRLNFCLPHLKEVSSPDDFDLSAGDYRHDIYRHQHRCPGEAKELVEKLEVDCLLCHRQTEGDQRWDEMGEKSPANLTSSASVVSSVEKEEPQLGKPCPLGTRETRQPMLQTRNSRSVDSFEHLLPDHNSPHDFKYKGVSNPPEVIRRGIARGNVAQIHQKAWLEVCDPKHRYGKNLRLYYRHWESLGCPTHQFFDWLDSKGEASGNPLPSIVECPRPQLESDTVLYIHDSQQTANYALNLVSDENGRCRVFDIHNNPACTGPDGWIFVLRDGIFYGAKKLTSVSADGCKQRFHHSTFFGGKAVAAAGIFITNDEGAMTLLYPHSGHYRPGEADMQRILFFVHQKGVDLSTFQVDIQQLVRVNRKEIMGMRQAAPKEEKKRKVDSLRLKPAEEVAYYLSHKARWIREGILSEISRINSACE